MPQQRTARSARDHALAVLRARNTLIAVVLLPAAVLAVLFAAGAAGHLPSGWTPLRAVLAGVTVGATTLALVLAGTIARARPAVTPTVEISERDAPALHALIRELADRLDVPEPGGVALTPDCDSWLEEPASRPFQEQQTAAGPVLVVGSPFLWWLRVPELRALLAPVVAGTGPSRHPDIAAARRAVRGLDAAAAAGSRASAWRQPRIVLAGRTAQLVLRLAGRHAAEMERGVATAAAARAGTVGEDQRVAAQEQVGLAYVGWDRLLTRVALPAWQLGRWPQRLNAGVVSSLSELSRRDRLAEGFAARLGQRPACDLLEEPGVVDEQVSLLAAHLFHGPDLRVTGASTAARERSGGDGTSDTREPSVSGGTGVGTGAGRDQLGAGTGADGTAALAWADYPAQVAATLWRQRAARLFAVLDGDSPPVLGVVLRRLSEGGEFAELLTTRLTARVAREVAAGQTPGGPADQPATDGAPGTLGAPLQTPPGGSELLAQHLAAAVCCTAIDTTGAWPELDWLDGPVLESSGGRLPDLDPAAHTLVEDADPGPLCDWLRTAGIAPDERVRLA